MEIETSLIRINGSTYMRLPPVMLKHAKIKETDTKAVIQDEEGKHGPFFSGWRKGEKNER